MAYNTDIRCKVPTFALIPFLAITFGLAWGVFVGLIFFTETVAGLFGEISASNPLFILAVYAPAIAALSLVMRYAGLSGVKGFLSRLLLWRCTIGWVAVLVVVIRTIYCAGALVKGSA